MSFLMSIRPLLTVLRFLPCATTAVGTRDVFFLFGLGLYLAVARVFARCATEDQTSATDNLVDVHGVGRFNGGTGAHP